MVSDRWYHVHPLPEKRGSSNHFEFAAVALDSGQPPSQSHRMFNVRALQTFKVVGVDTPSRPLQLQSWSAHYWKTLPSSILKRNSPNPTGLEAPSSHASPWGVLCQRLPLPMKDSVPGMRDGWGRRDPLGWLELCVTAKPVGSSYSRWPRPWET